MNQEQRRRYLCREHGICSCPECSEPIIGWEEKLWGRKLCEAHLLECKRRGELTYRPPRWAQDVQEIEQTGEIAQ
jgi:hypothetical protein